MTTFSSDRTFGVEFEAFNVDRRTLVAELRSVGIRAEMAYYSGSNFNLWQIKTDGSINGPQGFEVVSPVLRGDAGLAEVEKVLEIMNRLDAKVNRSCGFHVHWGVGDWGVKQFRNVSKRWMKFERSFDMIQPMSRRGNTNQYLQNFNSFNSLEVAFQKVDACRTVTQISEQFQGGMSGRYKKLNFKKFNLTGTVEFRHHSGTTDFAKVKAWLLLTNSMVADADSNKSIKRWAQGTDASTALKVLLNAAVRTGGIDAATRKFYTRRARQLVL